MADTLCGKCGRYFKGYRGLRIHEGKSACGGRPTVLPRSPENDTLCEKCGRYFKGYRGLRTHEGMTACGLPSPFQRENLVPVFSPRSYGASPRIPEPHGRISVAPSYSTRENLVPVFSPRSHGASPRIPEPHGRISVAPSSSPRENLVPVFSPRSHDASFRIPQPDGRIMVAPSSSTDYFNSIATSTSRTGCSYDGYRDVPPLQNELSRSASEMECDYPVNVNDTISSTPRANSTPKGNKNVRSKPSVSSASVDSASERVTEWNHHEDANFNIQASASPPSRTQSSRTAFKGYSKDVRHKLYPSLPEDPSTSPEPKVERDHQNEENTALRSPSTTHPSCTYDCKGYGGVSRQLFPSSPKDSSSSTGTVPKVKRYHQDKENFTPSSTSRDKSSYRPTYDFKGHGGVRRKLFPSSPKKSSTSTGTVPKIQRKVKGDLECQNIHSIVKTAIKTSVSRDVQSTSCTYNVKSSTDVSPKQRAAVENLLQPTDRIRDRVQDIRHDVNGVQNCPVDKKSTVRLHHPFRSSLEDKYKGFRDLKHGGAGKTTCTTSKPSSSTRSGMDVSRDTTKPFLSSRSPKDDKPMASSKSKRDGDPSCFKSEPDIDSYNTLNFGRREDWNMIHRILDGGDDHQTLTKTTARPSRDESSSDFNGPRKRQTRENKTFGVESTRSWSKDRRLPSRSKLTEDMSKVKDERDEEIKDEEGLKLKRGYAAIWEKISNLDLAWDLLASVFISIIVFLILVTNVFHMFKSGDNEDEG